MKKLIVPILSVVLCFACFITLCKVEPYLIGPLTPVNEAGGAIPMKVWFSAGLDLLEVLAIVGAGVCNCWLCFRFFKMLEERSEKRKKHDKGI